MSVPCTNSDNVMDLNTYLDTQSSPWWSYVTGFPGMVIGSVKSLFTDRQETIPARGEQGNIIELTKEESDKINILRNSVLATIDKKSAITSVSVTFQNPKVTAVVADSVVQRLQKHITAYRTSKA